MSASPYCTRPALASLAVVTTAGLTFGCMLMSIGIYIYFYFLSHDCGAMKSQTSCEGLSKFHSSSSSHGIGECIWDNGSCNFADYKTIDCGNFSSSSEACGTQSASCFFDHNEGKCFHNAGFAPAFAGIFAGASILGGIFSGVVADQLMKHLPWRKAAIINGCGTLIGGVLCTLGHYYDAFTLTIIGRILHGVMAFGITSIAVMYCRQRNPETANFLSGPPMQFFIAFGQFFLGAYGLAVDVKPSSSEDGDFNVQARVQGLLALGTYLPGAMMIVVAAFVHDASAASSHREEEREKAEAKASDKKTTISSSSTSSSASGQSTPTEPVATEVDYTPPTQGEVVFSHEPIGDSDSSNCTKKQQEKYQSDKEEKEKKSHEASSEEVVVKQDDDDTTAESSSSSEFSTCQMILFFLKGICVASALQFTGIGPFISFAPSIYANAGLDGMLGNFLGGIAQIFGAALAFAPGKLGISGRATFLAGLALCSLATFLAFLGAFPGIAQGDSATSASTALTMTGMVFYLIVFNAAVGPYSWVLMATVFPAELVQRGMATAVASMAGINLMINVLFPIAVDGISGGPTGNQGYGFGAMFLLFCAVGIIHFVVISCGVEVYQKQETAKEEGSEEKTVAESA